MCLYRYLYYNLITDCQDADSDHIDFEMLYQPTLGAFCAEVLRLSVAAARSGIDPKSSALLRAWLAAG